MANRDTVKPWFETGDKPTQAQFWQFFDWVRFLDDTITMAQVTGLVDALVAKVNTSDFEGQFVAMDTSYTFVIPAGYLLEKIIPGYGAAGAMQISLIGMGQSEILDKDDVPMGFGQPIQLDIFAISNTNLYIDGIPAGSKIIFLKRKIKTS